MFSSYHGRTQGFLGGLIQGFVVDLSDAEFHTLRVTGQKNTTCEEVQNGDL